MKLWFGLVIRGYFIYLYAQRVFDIRTKCNVPSSTVSAAWFGLVLQYTLHVVMVFEFYRTAQC